MFEETNNLFENPQNPSYQNVPMVSPGNLVPSAQMQAPTAQRWGYPSPTVRTQTIPAGAVNQQPQIVIKASDLHSYLMMQAELMKTCWENGAAVQRALDACGAAGAVSEPVPVASSAGAWDVDTCIGVYDRFGYGVFHNEAAVMDRMAKFPRFWDRRTLRQQTFASYPEALAFAKEGAARLTGRRADALPNPKYALDWKESIK